MNKKITAIVLAIVAALGAASLLLLVPSSPALQVEGSATLLWHSADYEPWMPGGTVISVYGLLIAVGAALAIALTAASARRVANRAGEALAIGDGLLLSLISGACALIFSHALFTVLRWGYIINDLGQSASFLFTPWKGGYTMYGAIIGGMLGTLIFCKVRRADFLACMDAVAPGMALLILLGRAAEKFTSQGMGTYVVNEALSMIPFVQVDEWGMTQVPVYIYEAIIAAIALIVMIVLKVKRVGYTGYVAETGLAIISAAQVMLDSWRGDELIRFGFVRLNMICAAVMLLAIIILRVYRAVKADGKWRVWTWLRIVLLFAAAGVVIALEFALDKSTINNTLLYGVMTAAIVVMGASVLINGKHKEI